jgi:4-amino-4-deoxy-L-arabinose transferase-like glycosyltransferase
VSIGVVAVVLLAAALRLHGLGDESLWFDEGHTLETARLSPAEATAALVEDVHPPLYFLSVSAWTRAFGESDASLRAPSAVFGVLAVLATFLLGRRLFGAGAGLAAAFLSAVAPFHVNYGQEARPYALLLLLALLSTHALVRLAEEPGRWGRRVAYGALAASLPYTHANGAFVLLAHASFGAVTLVRARGEERRALAAGALAATGVATVLLAPWLPSLLRQTGRVTESGWIPVPTPKIVRRAVVEHAGSAWALLVLAALALVAIATRDPGRARRAPRARLLVALLWLVPLAAPILLSFAGPRTFLPRTSIASSAALLLLAGAGIAALARRPGWGAAAGAAAALLVAALSGRTLARRVAYVHNQDLRGAAAVVERDALAGDVVVVGHSFERTALEHYLRRRDLDVLAASEDPVPEGARRVWLLPSIHTRRRAVAVARTLEERGLRPVFRRSLRRMEVERFEPEAPAPSETPDGT